MYMTESSYELTDVYYNKNIQEAGDVYLMCPNCYALYRVNISHISRFNIVTEDKGIISGSTYIDDRHIKIDCPACNHFDIEAIELDVNIAECISILNIKGYHTKYCCEGEQSSAYIMMEEKYPQIKELVTSSVYWELDEDFPDTDTMTIRCNTIRENRSIYSNMLHIAELYELIKKLPDKQEDKVDE